MDRRILLGLAGLAGVAALTRMAKAGELDPPPGPIGPTGISLSQLDQKVSSNNAGLSNKLSKIDAKVAFTDHGVSEPRTPIRSLSSSADAQFVISVPGAYCMTDNIEQAPGMVCIDIQCSDVDIDCQGFAFHGSGSAAMPPSSCVRSSGQSNIELYDCTFSSWRGCPIDCDDCDDVFVSDCAFRMCTCPPGIDSTGNTVVGAMVRCRDRCGLEELHISQCTGHQIQARHGCYVRDLEVCDGSGDAVVLGNDGSVDDAVFRNVQGGAVRCGSGACIDSCAVINGNVVIGGLTDSHFRCGDGSCVSDCEVRSSSGIAFSLGSSCVVDCCDVVGGSGGAFRCLDGCCLDGCTVLGHASPAVVCNMRTRINELECRLCVGLCVSVGVDSVVECCEVTGGSGGCYQCADRCTVEDCTAVSHTGPAILCGDGCCVTECDVRNCTGLAVNAGSNCVVECCEVSGGSGGAIYCADACCVEDCAVSSHQGIAVQCASRCSIESCRVVASWGVSCGPECCVHDNELSYDGSGGGGGGALNVLGERCSVTSNYVSGQIYIFGGANRCLIEDNHLVGSGGPPGTGGASLSIAAGVTGCSVRSNHIHRASTTNAFVIPPGNSFGPVVNTIAGGDLSTLPPDSNASHPHANFVS